MMTMPVTILLPVVFVIAAFVAGGAIWMTMSRYIGDIRKLHSQLRSPDTPTMIRMVYHPDSYEHNSEVPGTLRAIRRKRRYETASNAWSSHRLHHFHRSQTAA